MKERFPLLREEDVSYLDNAATTQKPERVIEAETDMYEERYANPHRGIYPLATEATNALEDAREAVAAYINADSDEVVFTRNTTEGLNMVARGEDVGGEILVTEYDHHSNYLPWKEKAKRDGLDFTVVEKDDARTLWESVSDETELVAFTWMSNVTGKILDVEKIVSEIRDRYSDVTIVVDCAQGMPHLPVDVKQWDVDYIAFSGHKIYGPTGASVLYGKQEKLDTLEPSLFGGGMVHDSLHDKWKETPHKFEAGTVNVPQIAALHDAVEFLDEHLSHIQERESALQSYLVERLRDEDVFVYEHDGDGFGPVVSFAVDDIHPHDFAEIAGRTGVCVRAGHHCAQPLMKAFETEATARASLGCYNDKGDVDKLIKAVEESRGIFHG